MQLPDLWFYGRVNDAEVLSVFPYAYNAVQFRFRVGA